MNPNDQAFPLNEERYYDETKIGVTYHEGLTKREYFAAIAMQGMLASGAFFRAEHAVKHADALIAALQKDSSKLNKHGVDEEYEAAMSDLNGEEEALTQELADDDLRSYFQAPKSH